MLRYEGFEVRAAAPLVESEIIIVLAAEQLRSGETGMAGEEQSPGAGRAVGGFELGAVLGLHLVTPEDVDHLVSPRGGVWHVRSQRVFSCAPAEAGAQLDPGLRRDT